MPQTWKPIKLAAKVIGHISQGMYRTPAGAIKELVSNAYDAGATYAKIHTGFPRFGTFSCEDDGSGIEISEFKRLMEGGIGDSNKQSTREQNGKYGRPIIGRLGVGLLSLGQICTEFKITSCHPKSKTAFEAVIRFPAYTRQELDRLKAQLKKSGKRLVQSGHFSLKKMAYRKGRTGITIFTENLRHAFRKTMGNLEHFGNTRFSKTRDSYSSFDEFIDAITQPQLRSLFRASPYDQLIFGVSLASPIPFYVPVDEKERGSVLLEIPAMARLQRQLQSYAFRVELDNITLARPVILPSTDTDYPLSSFIVPKEPTRGKFKLNDGTLTESVAFDKYEIPVAGTDFKFQLFHFNYEQEVNGYPLKFSGYIFLQTSRLFPKELQGVLVRIRHIAIGGYDVNVMTYPYAEGPRFSMLSSEIFVEEGLDDALKVDRDGFNGLDPHYMRIQAFVHSILHEVIFPGSWTEEKSRNKERREKRSTEHLKRFNTRLKATQGTFTSVSIKDSSPKEPQTGPVSVDVQTGHIEVYNDHPALKEIAPKKKNRAIASQVLAAFEIANRESSADRRREIFYKLLSEVFGE